MYMYYVLMYPCYVPCAGIGGEKITCCVYGHKPKNSSAMLELVMQCDEKRTFYDPILQLESRSCLISSCRAGLHVVQHVCGN